MSTYDRMELMAEELDQSLKGLRQTLDETRLAIRSGETHLAAVRFAIAQGRAREAKTLGSRP